MLNKIPLTVFGLFIVALCFSCKPNALPPAKPSFRDSLVKQCINQLDSLRYHDSTTLDYKMLKAYVLNDTAWLKRFQQNLAMYKETGLWEDCFKIKDFKELDGEAIYRFIYEAAFNRYQTVVTVVKSNDSIVVNTQVCRSNFDSRSDSLSEQQTVLLNNAQWEKFSALLSDADFWGLKEKNGESGFDGDNLWVYGYQRFPSRGNYIYRWSPGEAILKPFILLLEYSKTKNGYKKAKY